MQNSIFAPLSKVPLLYDGTKRPTLAAGHPGGSGDSTLANTFFFARPRSKNPTMQVRTLFLFVIVSFSPPPFLSWHARRRRRVDVFAPVPSPTHIAGSDLDGRSP